MGPLALPDGRLRPSAGLVLPPQWLGDTISDQEKTLKFLVVLVVLLAVCAIFYAALQVTLDRRGLLLTVG